MCYPELASDSIPEPCNEWTQRSRPQDGNARRVGLVSTPFEYRASPRHIFNGLARTNSQAKNGPHLSVIKGAPSSTQRWFTIGALVLEEGKIPGPLNKLVSKVLLFAKPKNRITANTGRRKKREATDTDTAPARPETLEEIAERSYGSQLRYQCGPARRFFDEETSEYYDERFLDCNWNKTWTPVDVLDSCEWTQCLYPPSPPEDNHLQLDWDGLPVDFNDTVSYRCATDDTYFLFNNTVDTFNVTCLRGGTWENPKK